MEAWRGFNVSSLAFSCLRLRAFPGQPWAHWAEAVTLTGEQKVRLVLGVCK